MIRIVEGIMNIGERIVLTSPAIILKSKITYKDKEKSCGWAKVIDEKIEPGIIIGFKSGWFFNYWIVALDNGIIKKVKCQNICNT